MMNLPADAQSNTAASWLTIDLGAVGRNYKMLDDLSAPTCKTAGVIKADGYGLGMAKIWAALESQNCPLYFVATLDEALALRSLTKKPIFVLGGLYKNAEDIYLHKDITPIINSPEEWQRWLILSQKRSVSLKCVIHIDTAMNRLGFSHDEWVALIDDKDVFARLKPSFIMTHLACGDERAENGGIHEVTRAQAEKFQSWTSGMAQNTGHNILRSFCNSAGIFGNKENHYDLTRPGMALYGLNPTPHAPNPMQPVISLKTRILQIRHAQKGETVGYGATHKFDKDTKLATVALGYADGFLRSQSGRGMLYFNDIPCPIVGRVSMDLVTVSLENIAKADMPMPHAGQIMDVIGAMQSADDLAQNAGTIGYEILTSLGARYHRHYI
jgi:alanine racemase